MIRSPAGRASVAASTAVLLVAPLALLSAPAGAAESYDGCTAWITSLPAVIATQGVWCMRADLATSMASGAAITVNAPNVTIDCNHFKLGGLAAGLATATFGIRSSGRANTTVRRCNVRGFLVGVGATSEDGGHLVEDSRFDSNTAAGVWVAGDGSVVRRNQVLHTGGTTGPGSVAGIHAEGSVQILDNQVEGVTNGTDPKSGVRGINLGPNIGGRIAGNAISGLLHTGGGNEVAIFLHEASGATVRGNDIVGLPTKTGTGVYCFDSIAVVRDNSIIRMAPLSGCDDAGGNYTIF